MAPFDLRDSKKIESESKRRSRRGSITTQTGAKDYHERRHEWESHDGGTPEERREPLPTFNIRLAIKDDGANPPRLIIVPLSSDKLSGRARADAILLTEHQDWCEGPPSRSSMRAMEEALYHLILGSDVQQPSPYPNVRSSGYDSREPYRYQDNDYVGDYKRPPNLTQPRTTSGNRANEGNVYEAASRRTTYYEPALHYDAPRSQSNPESPDHAPKTASSHTDLDYAEYMGSGAETKSRDHERRYSTIDPPLVKVKPHKRQPHVLYSRPPMVSLHPEEYAVDDDPTVQPLRRQPFRRNPSFCQSQYRVSIAPAYQVDDYAHYCEPRDKGEDSRGRAAERDRERWDEDERARRRRRESRYRRSGNAYYEDGSRGSSDDRTINRRPTGEYSREWSSYGKQTKLPEQHRSQYL
ncbi:hypothetical protein DL766_007502 [Monosporascus sp. MC13-8B]|uniref:Uncharacterized protein n=1 Tax=Monosporascus cannonballus TaxID=155416 RepID=A0ABY0H3U1_9PEZI|nr:hypothetical protein DL762_007392 [Monosporascus cannonballus]RYO85653.1 hypothetical protein DL763_007016 [Monosporascus cannonballus]RYP23497.1 hypothetical protein DL766_007502 [Monosporascus sp. MC13-8B]